MTESKLLLSLSESDSRRGMQVLCGPAKMLFLGDEEKGSHLLEVHDSNYCT